jgi:hypothetical protein
MDYIMRFSLTNADPISSEGDHGFQLVVERVECKILAMFAAW